MSYVCVGLSIVDKNSTPFSKTTGVCVSILLQSFTIGLFCFSVGKICLHVSKFSLIFWVFFCCFEYVVSSPNRKFVSEWKGAEKP